jgi:hypothetical protein
MDVGLLRVKRVVFSTDHIADPIEELFLTGVDHNFPRRLFALKEDSVHEF